MVNLTESHGVAPVMTSEMQYNRSRGLLPIHLLSAISVIWQWPDRSTVACPSSQLIHCGWKGNSRSVTALAMHHRLNGISSYRLSDPGNAAIPPTHH